MIIICSDRDKHLDDIKWINNFGNDKKYQIEYYGRVTSIRVWYENNIEIEFGFSTKKWAEFHVDKLAERVVKDF